MSEGVGEHEASDIRALVTRVLNDLGSPEPPLSLDMVRELLKLDLKYYSTSNTSFLQDVAHRMKLAGKQIIDRPMVLLEAVQKAKLSALWVPDAKRILIDQNVPDAKHRWIQGHEIGHSLIPWHREFLFGDNEYTLTPACHAMVEAEANYAAAQLLFLQDKFVEEARDGALDFGALKKLATRYGNTMTTTLWRMVEERDPTFPVFGLISAHPRHPSIGRGEDGSVVRHFIRSDAFLKRFASSTGEQCYALVAKHCGYAKGGPVVDASDFLIDADGEPQQFRIRSFCNSHAVLTMGEMTGPAPIVSFGT